MVGIIENSGKGFPKGRTIQEFAAKQRKLGRVFPFTMQDIADSIGRTIQTVRRAKANKEFDPRNLRSLSEYVAGHPVKQKKGGKV